MNSLTLAFISLATGLITQICWGHAILIQSSPKDQSKLQSSPNQVVLRFNGKIEKKVSQITLQDGQGHKVPIPGTSKALTSGAPDTLVIPLPQLGPGSYQLQYRILAIDGHATPGRIHFSISEKPTS